MMYYAVVARRRGYGVDIRYTATREEAAQLLREIRRGNTDPKRTFGIRVVTSVGNPLS